MCGLPIILLACKTSLAGQQPSYYTVQGTTDVVQTTAGGNGVMTVVANTKARFVKVAVKNYGVIPDGKAGGGNKAWLFADEIEVR